MAASLAEGETVLENAAREPEVSDLANFLIRCGARIEGHGTSEIHIHGVSRLHGCEYAVMPDRIEAGTFLAAAGITDGELTLLNCPCSDMDAVLDKLKAAGLDITPTPDGRGVTARRAAGGLRGVDVSTRPHPGFPTDMQAQIMALLCVARARASWRKPFSKTVSCTCRNWYAWARTSACQVPRPWCAGFPD